MSPDEIEPACWSWNPETAHQELPDYLARRNPLQEEVDDWLLAEWHERRCAICGDRDRLVNDHDHKTGLMRGLLCNSCNVMEGVSDDPLFAKYREKHPAAILGVKVRYWSPVTGYAQPQEDGPIRSEALSRLQRVLGELL